MAGMHSIIAGAAYVKFSLDNRELKKGIGEAQSRIKQFENDILKMSNRIVLVTAMLSQPFTYIINQFANFDLKMRQVKAITGSSSNEIAKLTEKTRKLGRETSFTTVQISEALVMLSRMGFSAKQLEHAIEPIMKMSKATGESLELSAEVAGNALRIFGKDASELADVADILVATTNGSSQSLQDLHEAMAKAGPVFVQTGSTIEEMSASLGVLGNMGIKGSFAGTALARMFKRLSETKVQDLLHQYGVEVTDLQKRFRPLHEILRDVYYQMVQMDAASRINFSQQLFEVRGSLVGLPLSMNIEQVDEFLDSLRNVGGIATRQADEMEKGMYGSIQHLISAAQDLNIEIGKILEGTLIPIIKSFTETINDAKKPIGEIIKMIEPLASMISSFSLVFIGFGVFAKLKDIIQSVLAPIKKLNDFIISGYDAQDKLLKERERLDKKHLLNETRSIKNQQEQIRNLKQEEMLQKKTVFESEQKKSDELTKAKADELAKKDFLKQKIHRNESVLSKYQAFSPEIEGDLSKQLEVANQADAELTSIFKDKAEKAKIANGNLEKAQHDVDKMKKDRDQNLKKLEQAVADSEGKENRRIRNIDLDSQIVGITEEINDLKAQKDINVKKIKEKNDELSRFNKGDYPSSYSEKTAKDKKTILRGEIDQLREENKNLSNVISQKDIELKRVNEQRSVDSRKTYSEAGNESMYSQMDSELSQRIEAAERERNKAKAIKDKADADLEDAKYSVEKNREIVDTLKASQKEGKKERVNAKAIIEAENGKLKSQIDEINAGNKVLDDQIRLQGRVTKEAKNAYGKADREASVANDKLQKTNELLSTQETELRKLQTLPNGVMETQEMKEAGQREADAKRLFEAKKADNDYAMLLHDRNVRAEKSNNDFIKAKQDEISQMASLESNGVRKSEEAMNRWIALDDAKEASLKRRENAEKEYSSRKFDREYAEEELRDLDSRWKSGESGLTKKKYHDRRKPLEDNLNVAKAQEEIARKNLKIASDDFDVKAKTAEVEKQNIANLETESKLRQKNIADSQRELEIAMQKKSVLVGNTEKSKDSVSSSQNELNEATENYTKARLDSISAEKIGLSVSDRHAKALIKSTDSTKGLVFQAIRHSKAMKRVSSQSIETALNMNYMKKNGVAAGRLLSLKFKAMAISAKGASMAVNALGKGIAFIKANMITVALLGIGALYQAYNYSVDSLVDSYEKLVRIEIANADNIERENEKRKETLKSVIGIVNELVKIEELGEGSTKELNKAKDAIAEIKNRYGDLNITIDETKKKITGAVEAQKKLNLELYKRNKESKKDEITGAKKKIQRIIGALPAKSYKKSSKWSSFKSGWGFGNPYDMDEEYLKALTNIGINRRKNKGNEPPYEMLPEDIRKMRYKGDGFESLDFSNISRYIEKSNVKYMKKFRESLVKSIDNLNISGSDSKDFEYLLSEVDEALKLMTDYEKKFVTHQDEKKRPNGLLSITSDEDKEKAEKSLNELIESIERKDKSSFQLGREDIEKRFQDAYNEVSRIKIWHDYQLARAEDEYNNASKKGDTRGIRDAESLKQEAIANLQKLDAKKKTLDSLKEKELNRVNDDEEASVTLHKQAMNDFINGLSKDSPLKPILENIQKQEEDSIKDKTFDNGIKSIEKIVSSQKDTLKSLLEKRLELYNSVSGEGFDITGKKLTDNQRKIHDDKLSKLDDSIRQYQDVINRGQESIRRIEENRKSIIGTTNQEREYNKNVSTSKIGEANNFLNEMRREFMKEMIYDKQDKDIQTVLDRKGDTEAIKKLGIIIASLESSISADMKKYTEYNQKAIENGFYSGMMNKNDEYNTQSNLDKIKQGVIELESRRQELQRKKDEILSRKAEAPEKAQINSIGSFSVNALSRAIGPETLQKKIAESTSGSNEKLGKIFLHLRKSSEQFYENGNNIIGD